MRDLEHAARAWVTKLPSVLWGLRTTPNRSTNRTPFFMVYGAEAVLPSDLLHNSPRVELYSATKLSSWCLEQGRRDKMWLISWKRRERWLLSARPLINKIYDVLTAGTSEAGPFRKEILCSEWISSDLKSLLLRGKVLLSFQRFYTTEHITCTTL